MNDKKDLSAARLFESSPRIAVLPQYLLLIVYMLILVPIRWAAGAVPQVTQSQSTSPDHVHGRYIGEQLARGLGGVEPESSTLELHTEYIICH